MYFVLPGFFSKITSSFITSNHNIIVSRMTSIRPFQCDDLFKFNHINLDPLTETYNIPFYLQYLSTWPAFCSVVEDPSGRLMGYVLGKAEGEGKLWHGHVTAVTVSSEYRRLGVAKKLMSELEEISTTTYNGFFVDLFVRQSNALAISMYNHFGYTTFRRVLGYYGSEEDALDMRKALPRDVKQESVIPMTRPVTPQELEW